MTLPGITEDDTAGAGFTVAPTLTAEHHRRGHGRPAGASRSTARPARPRQVAVLARRRREPGPTWAPCPRPRRCCCATPTCCGTCPTAWPEVPDPHLPRLGPDGRRRGHRRTPRAGRHGGLQHGRGDRLPGRRRRERRAGPGAVGPVAARHHRGRPRKRRRDGRPPARARLTDVDSGALLGLAVHAADPGNGAWQYSPDGASWTALPSVSPSAALLLPTYGGCGSSPTVERHHRDDRLLRVGPDLHLNGRHDPRRHGGLQRRQRDGLAGRPAVNDAPEFTVPGPQAASDGSALVFSAGSANPLSLADVDADAEPVSVTLDVDKGVLTLATDVNLDLRRRGRRGRPGLHRHAGRRQRGARRPGLSLHAQLQRHGHADLRRRRPGQHRVGRPAVGHGPGQITVDSAVDLGVSVTGPAAVAPGLPLTYTVVFSNAGPGDATAPSCTSALRRLDARLDLRRGRPRGLPAGPRPRRRTS